MDVTMEKDVKPRSNYHEYESNWDEDILFGTYDDKATICTAKKCAYAAVSLK